MHKLKILVADGSANHRGVISERLNELDYEVVTTSNGREALELVTRRGFDLVLVDALLPGLDGYEICQRIKKVSNLPTIIIGGQGDEASRIYAFRLGADDYLPKPLSVTEMVLRVRAILSRVVPEARWRQPWTESILCVGDLEMNGRRFQTTVGGRQVPLSLKEFKLLWLLASHPGVVYTRSELFQHLYGNDCENDYDCITVLISRLRRKIDGDSTERRIQTLRGAGYKFEAIRREEAVPTRGGEPGREGIGDYPIVQGDEG
ncbi:MAG: response regulator transcription factor [Firmicutes bacterium]|nr:response regulator transcription factor [Bacillota bacterium]MCL5040250.1 response regulator transcription factor [Bacillota bacterium]